MKKLPGRWSTIRPRNSYNARQLVELYKPSTGFQQARGLKQWRRGEEMAGVHIPPHALGWRMRRPNKQNTHTLTRKQKSILVYFTVIIIIVVYEILSSCMYVCTYVRKGNKKSLISVQKSWWPKKNWCVVCDAREGRRTLTTRIRNLLRDPCPRWLTLI